MTDTIMTVAFLAVMAGIAVAVMMITHRNEKRGCGRGCATCPNREICYRNGKKGKRKS